MGYQVLERRRSGVPYYPRWDSCQNQWKNLRDHILRECFLHAIVSLPRRTFFANEKDTYILAITKKNDPDDIQTDSVFTYLVSNIGSG